MEPIPIETVTPSTPQQPPYSTWLLETLFTGRHRKWHSAASLALGLLGLIAFALLTTAGLTVVLHGIQLNRSSVAFQALVMMTIFPLGITLCYTAVLFSLQWIASCRLFFTIRLAIVYAIIFCLLNILDFGGFAIEGGHVLLLAPFSAFGFVQHYRGWTALAWGQVPRPTRRLGIGNLMDATAAIALTLAMTQTADFKVAGLACLIPASLLMASMGIHIWGRLQMFSLSRPAIETGQVIWHTGNVFCALVLFLAFAVIVRETPVGLFGFLLIPILVLIAHRYTGFAMQWLRWCGWSFENPSLHRAERVLPDVLFIPAEILTDQHNAGDKSKREPKGESPAKPATQ